MPYTPIVATLGYVLSPDRSQVLLIHRNARPDDQHLGKYNGLGGKIERDEDVVAGMRREIHEEAGIDCEAMTLRAASDARVMLLGGEAFTTPRHLWWNFVSSSRDRINEAKHDWKDRKFPLVPGDSEEFIPIPEVPKTVSYP